jgi:hypothetical protein
MMLDGREGARMLHSMMTVVECVLRAGIFGRAFWGLGFFLTGCFERTWIEPGGGGWISMGVGCNAGREEVRRT